MDVEKVGRWAVSSAALMVDEKVVSRVVSTVVGKAVSMVDKKVVYSVEWMAGQKVDNLALLMVESSAVHWAIHEKVE